MLPVGDFFSQVNVFLPVVVYLLQFFCVVIATNVNADAPKQTPQWRIQGGGAAQPWPPQSPGMGPSCHFPTPKKAPKKLLLLFFSKVNLGSPKN